MMPIFDEKKNNSMECDLHHRDLGAAQKKTAQFLDG
jgi:hypothetical protein